MASLSRPVRPAHPDVSSPDQGAVARQADGTVQAAAVHVGDPVRTIADDPRWCSSRCACGGACGGGRVGWRAAGADMRPEALQPVHLKS